jgi:choline dehydrogenase-like flavoprotein
MDALGQSAELLRRSDELRARSARNRADAAQRRATAVERVEKSRQLIAAAAKAREAVLHAHRWEPAGRAVALSPAEGGC